MKSLCRRPPIAAQPRRDVGVSGCICSTYRRFTGAGLSTSASPTNWSATRDSNSENPRSERSTYASSVSGGWCSVAGSNRSLALERRGVSPETQRNVAIVRRLELRKPGLRGLLLEPLCIHDHVGGAHRNRTDQAICLQGKSGFLARTP